MLCDAGFFTAEGAKYAKDLLKPNFFTVPFLNKGANGIAVNLFDFFLLLIVFELLTSTKIGDLMRARREYRYR